MATRRYGMSRGERRRANGVTEAVGAATASDSIEVTVDLAVGLRKLDVLLALGELTDHVSRSKWPPA